MYNISSIKQKFTNTLRIKYSSDEVSSMWYNWVVKELLNIAPISYFTKGDFQINKTSVNRINALIEHLFSYKPIQYFFGYTYFKGLKIGVDSNVLIPRPETEELVDIVINHINRDVISNIIDIGTGSGCIAISLQKKLNFKMFAVDFSNRAIKKAVANSIQHNVQIDFQLIDILNVSTHDLLPKIDVIVSNPPYVLNSEVPEKSVIHAEPRSAIFIPDDNPLIFYKSILKFANTNLNTGGYIFFEINPKFISELLIIIDSYGYLNIKIHKDFYGKKRFIVVTS